MDRLAAAEAATQSSLARLMVCERTRLLGRRAAARVGRRRRPRLGNANAGRLLR